MHTWAVVLAFMPQMLRMTKTIVYWQGSQGVSAAWEVVSRDSCRHTAHTTKTGAGTHTHTHAHTRARTHARTHTHTHNQHAADHISTRGPYVKVNKLWVA